MVRPFIIDLFIDDMHVMLGAENQPKPEDIVFAHADVRGDIEEGLRHHRTTIEAAPGQADGAFATDSQMSEVLHRNDRALFSMEHVAIAENDICVVRGG